MTNATTKVSGTAGCESTKTTLSVRVIKSRAYEEWISSRRSKRRRQFSMGLYPQSMILFFFGGNALFWLFSIVPFLSQHKRAIASAISWPFLCWFAMAWPAITDPALFANQTVQTIHIFLYGGVMYFMLLVTVAPPYLDRLSDFHELIAWLRTIPWLQRKKIKKIYTIKRYHIPPPMHDRPFNAKNIMYAATMAVPVIQLQMPSATLIVEGRNLECSIFETYSDPVVYYIGLIFIITACILWLYGFYMTFSTEIQAYNSRQMSRPIMVAESIPVYTKSPRVPTPQYRHTPVHEQSSTWALKMLLLFNILFRFAEYLMSRDFVQRFAMKISKMIDDRLPKSDRHKKFEDAFREAATAASYFQAESGKYDPGKFQAETAIGPSFDWVRDRTSDVLKDIPSGFFMDFTPAKEQVTDTYPLAGILDRCSMHTVLITFVLGVLSAPRWSESKARCLANFTSLFASLFLGFRNSFPSAFPYLISTVRECTGLKSPMVAEDGSPAPGWLETIASSFDTMKQFKQTPVCNILKHFATFMILLPIPFSAGFDPSSIRTYWEKTYSHIERFGTSISHIVRSIITIQTRVYADGCAGGTALLRSMFVPNNTALNFADCASTLRLLQLGDDSVAKMSSDELLAKFRKTVMETKAEAARVDSTPYARNCYDKANIMLEDLTYYLIKRNRRPVPFVVALDGPPGTGKTEFCTSCIFPSLHLWKGIESTMDVSVMDISQEWDNTSTNSTTAILLDDQGNLLPDKRKRALASAVLSIIQGHSTEIPKPFGDKGKQFYQNSFVALCDNTAERGFSSEIYAPAAGLRRMQFSAHVSLAPEFVDKKTGLLDKTHPGLNPYGAHLRFQAYEWGIDKNGSPHQIPLHQGLIDAPEFLILMRTKMLKHFESQGEKLTASVNIIKDGLCKHNLLPEAMCPKCRGVVMDISESMVAENLSMMFSPLATSIGEFQMSAVHKTVLYTGIVLRQRLRNQNWFFRRFDDFIQWFGLKQIASTLLLSWVIIYARGLHDLQFNFIMKIGSFFLFLFCIGWLQVRHAYLTLITKTESEIAEYKMMLSRHAPYIKIMLATVAGVLTTAAIWRSFVVTIAPDFAAEDLICDKSESATLSTAPDSCSEISDLKPTTSDHAWKRPERVYADVIGVNARTCTLDQLIPAVHASTLRGLIILANGTSSYTQGFLLSSQRMILPYHGFLNNPYPSFVFKCQLGTGDKVIDRTLTINTVNLKRIPGKDIAVIFLGNHPFGSRKDFLPFVPTTLPKGTIVGTRTWIERDTEIKKSASVEITKALDGSYTRYSADGSMVEITCKDAYHAYLHTTASALGECGSVYIQNAKPHAILGIHVAGNYDKVRTTYDAFIAPFTRGEIEALDKEFRSIGFIAEVDMIPFPETILGVNTGLTHTPNPKHPVHFLEESLQPPVIFGEIQTGFTPKSQLSVNPDLEIAEEVFGLRRVKGIPTMRWKRSTHRMLKDALEVKPEGDPIRMGEAVTMFSRDIPPLVKRLKERYPTVDFTRPLTMEEALNGFDGVPIPTLKLSKAASWPVYGKKSDHVDNIDTPGGRTPTKLLREEIEKGLERLRNCQHLGQVATCCLKDEPVKLEKLSDVRIFFADSITSHMLNLMFLGPALTLISEFPVEFETSIGADPTGPFMEKIIVQFTHPEFKSSCFDIDFKAYDCNQSPRFRSFIMQIIERILEAMGYSEEDMHIVRQLLACLQCPIVNVFGTFMNLVNILPSGFLGTAHFNGLGSVSLTRYDFLRFMQLTVPENVDRVRWLMSELNKYCAIGELCKENYPILTGGTLDIKEFIRITTLGDDLLGGASRFYRLLGWTPAHFAESASEWGLTVTDGAKGFNFDFKPFEKCEFLRRFYNYNPDMLMNVLVAGPASYLRPFFLFSKGKNWERSEYFADCLRDILRESAYGGRKSFELRHSQVIEYVSRTDIAAPEVLTRTYDDWVSIVQQSPDWSPQDQYLPVTETGMRLIEEYESKTHVFSRAGRMIAETDDQTGLTTDANPVGDTGGMSVPMSEALEPVLIPRTEHAQFLERRWALGSFPWNGEGLNGNQTTWYCLPFYDLLNMPIIRSKLSHIAYFSAEIELTVELIAPRTIAGALMMTVHLPPDSRCVLESSPDMADLAGWSQKPGILMMIGNSSSKYKMTVPFLYPDPMVSVSDMESLKNLCTVTLTQIVPLMSSTGAVPPITVSMYAEFKKLRTSGATIIEHPGRGTSAFMAETDSFIPRATEKGSILRTIKSVSPHPATRSSDTSFSAFHSKWTMVDRIDFNTSHVVGSLLTSLNVTPMIFVQSTNNSDEIQPASCAVPGMFHEYWKGGMMYKIQVVLPTIMSASLKILYDPLMPNNEGASGDDLHEDLNEHIIIDCVENSTQEFTIGYSVCESGLFTMPRKAFTGAEIMSSMMDGKGSTSPQAVDPSSLAASWRDSTSGSATHHNGRLEIRVHAPLVTASGGPMNAKILIYAKAASDMTVWSFNGGLPNKVRPVVPVPFQSKVINYEGTRNPASICTIPDNQALSCWSPSSTTNLGVPFPCEGTTAPPFAFQDSYEAPATAPTGGSSSNGNGNDPSSGLPNSGIYGDPSAVDADGNVVLYDEHGNQLVCTQTNPSATWDPSGNNTAGGDPTAAPSGGILSSLVPTKWWGGSQPPTKIGDTVSPSAEEIQYDDGATMDPSDIESPDGPFDNGNDNGNNNVNENTNVDIEGPELDFDQDEKPEPTPQPSLKPSPIPSRPPTKGPTDAPTKGPTKAPTKGPTDAPTKGPTNPPTKGPTPGPTKNPVPDPTPRPTNRPPTPNPAPGPTRPTGKRPTKGGGGSLGDIMEDFGSFFGAPVKFNESDTSAPTENMESETPSVAPTVETLAPSSPPYELLSLDGRLTRDGFAMVDNVENMELRIFNHGTSFRSLYMSLVLVPTGLANSYETTGFYIGSWNAPTASLVVYDTPPQAEHPILIDDPGYRSPTSHTTVNGYSCSRSVVKTAPVFPGYTGTTPAMHVTIGSKPGTAFALPSILTINRQAGMNVWIKGGQEYSQRMPSGPIADGLSAVLTTRSADPHLVPVTKLTENVIIPNNLSEQIKASYIAQKILVTVLCVVYSGTDPGSVWTHDGEYPLDPAYGGEVKACMVRMDVTYAHWEIQPGSDSWFYMLGYMPTFGQPVPGVVSVDFPDPANLPERSIPARRLSTAGVGRFVAETDPMISTTESSEVAIAPVATSTSRMGGGKTNTKRITEHLSGESVRDFNTLMKIPSLMCRIISTDMPGTIPQPIIMSTFDPAGPEDTASLWWYMCLCFSGMKGGMMKRFSIIGDASIEVRRTTTMGVSHPLGLTGAERTNSNLNPVLTVRMPFQYNHEYLIARGGWESPNSFEHIMLYAHSGTAILSIERFIADDFSLLGYRGAARLRIT